MSRGAAIAAAVAVAVVGVVAGVALAVVMAGQRVQSAVAGIARAPVGCTTTLAFDDPGTFWVYVETRGRLDAVAGDCDATERWELAEAPAVAVEVVVGDDTRLDLTDDSSRSYDVDDFAGRSVATFDIVVPGRRTITATSDTAGFAVAVGRDPAAAATPWRWGGVAVAVASLLAAAALATLGRRRASGPPVDGHIATLPLRDPSSEIPMPVDAPWAPPPWAPPSTPAPPSAALPPPGSTLPPPG